MTRDMPVQYRSVGKRNISMGKN